MGKRQKALKMAVLGLAILVTMSGCLKTGGHGNNATTDNSSSVTTEFAFLEENHKGYSQ